MKKFFKKKSFMDGFWSGLDVSLVSTALILIIFSPFIQDLPFYSTKIYCSILVSNFVYRKFSNEKNVLSEVPPYAALTFLLLANDIKNNLTEFADAPVQYFIGAINIIVVLSGLTMLVLARKKLDGFIRFLPRSTFTAAIGVLILKSFQYPFLISGFNLSSAIQWEDAHETTTKAIDLYHSFLQYVSFLKKQFYFYGFNLFAGLALGAYLIDADIKQIKYKDQIKKITKILIIFTAIQFLLKTIHVKESFFSNNVYYPIGKTGSFLGIFNPFDLNQLGFLYGKFSFYKLKYLAHTIIFTFLAVIFMRAMEIASLDFDLKKEINSNQEMKNISYSYLINSLLGFGFLNRYNLSALNTFSKKYNKYSPYLLAGYCVPLFFLIIQPQIVFYLPKFLFLAIFMKVLYGMFMFGVVNPITQATKEEKAILIISMFSVWYLGVLKGTILNFTLLMLKFSFAYMKSRIVKSKFTLVTLQSTIQRDVVDTMILSRIGGRVDILILEGYLFFGNIFKLKSTIIARIKKKIEEKNPLKLIILDFKNVQNVDNEFIYNLNIINEIAKTYDVKFYLSHIRHLMNHDAIDASIKTFSFLDEALIAAEDTIIQFDQQKEEYSDQLDKIFADKSLKDLFISYGSFKNLSPFSMIYLEKSAVGSLYFLVSGEVNLMSTGDISHSAQLFSQVVKKGTFIGEGEIFLDGVSRSTALTKTPTVVFEITLDRLVELEREHPAVIIELHRQLLIDCFYRIDRSKLLTKELLGYSEN